MVFQPGQSGNIGGRPPKGYLTKGLLRRGDLKKAKDINGLDLIASIAACARFAVATRLQAAINLAQWQNLKPSEKVGRDLGLPEPTTVEQATANLARIATEAAADRITPAVARDLADLQQRFIDARAGQDVEARLERLEKALERFRPPVEIMVESSVGVMPGLENVLLPPCSLSVPNGGKGDREPGP
jgi:hypothetical protein